MPPDLVLISPYPPPGLTHAGHSGVASYTAYLARALSGEGAEVAIVAPATEAARSDHQDQGVAVHRVPARGPSGILALASAASRMGASVIHLQHETFLFGGPSTLVGLPAALASLRRGDAASVVTMHQVISAPRITREFTRMHRIRVPPILARSAMRSLQNALLGSFDGVIVHQDAFADILPGAIVIPHGVEKTPRLDIHAARGALGVEGEERLVAICFGFIAPYKGLELALEAASRVPEVRLVVAGGPHPRFGPAYARELRRRWGAFADFTGRVPDREVPLWHAAADLALFCYPAPHASSGALALALAHETPFLATSELARCVDAPEVVEIARHPEVLARRLRELALDRESLAGLREASRQMAGASTWPTVAQRHLDLYEEMRGAHRVGRRALRAVRSR